MSAKHVKIIKRNKEIFMGLLFSVYNSFKLKNWLKYSQGKRQRIIERVEAKQAKKLRRPVLPVVVNIDPNCPYFGMFENSANRQILHINIKLLSEPALRFHALETVLHEGRHAYQYNIIKNNKIRFFEFKKKKWRQNYAGYISSAEDKLFYGMQPIERDAQRYSIKKLEKMKFRFKNEDDYYTTLETMTYRYSETEKQLKEQHGIFYGRKINNKIKKKSARKSKFGFPEL